MKNYYINNEVDKTCDEKYVYCRNQIISQKDVEYTEFICFILEQRNWENDIMIIKGEEYDRFTESDIEDDIMDMYITDSDEFYNEFKKVSNVDMMDEDCFVSMKYINKNDINLIVRANGMNQRFVIGV
jgi:hypothetical protein